MIYKGFYVYYQQIVIKEVFINYKKMITLWKLEIDFSYGVFTQNVHPGNLGKNRAKIDETLKTLNSLWLNIADEKMYEMKRRKKLHLAAAKDKSPNNLERLNEKSAKA